MRMPLLTYFGVVGTVLIGLLLLVNKQIEPAGSPLPTSQIIGVPKPFIAPPEPPPDLTGLNFAAEHESAATVQATMPAPTFNERRKQKAVSSDFLSPTPNSHWIAEYPHDNLSIH